MGIWEIVKKIVLWSYDRGSWQYDILAVLILAFIFFTPHSVLDSRRALPAHATELYIPASDLTRDSFSKDAKLTELLSKAASRRSRLDVRVERYEVDLDAEGRIKGFQVWYSVLER